MASLETLNYDAVAVLTYTTSAERIDHRLELELSALSEAAIDAAVTLHQAHPASRLYIAGEHSFGMDYPSTSELMRERAITEFGVDDAVITIDTDKDTNLINTPQQMERLSQIIPLGSKIVAVALGFHLSRVLRHAEAYGLSVDGQAVEKILNNAGTLENYPELNHIGPLARRERVINILSRLNPRGNILDFLANIQGPRLHDVIETGDGGYETVMSTSRKRADELKIKLAI